MSSKLLVSMLALGLAAGGGTAWAQGTSGTGNTQMQSQSSGDESTQSGQKGTQSHRPGRQMGQAGQENTQSGTQMRRSGEMKQGEMKRSGEKQGQGTMQSDRSPSKTSSQGSAQNSADQSTRPQAQGQSTSTGATSTPTQAQGQSTSTGATNTRSEGTSETGSLTSQQRTRITDVFKKENIRPEENANFSVSIGTEVPKTIHLHRLPREIVEVQPTWRAFEFVRVGDDILIVNPRTFQIVAVMPA